MEPKDKLVCHLDSSYVVTDNQETAVTANDPNFPYSLEKNFQVLLIPGASNEFWDIPL